MTSSTDRIEKKTLLRAPRSRVWRAIADAREFGAWFGVSLEGSFTPGAHVRGKLTNKAYEHITMEILGREGRGGAPFLIPVAPLRDRSQG